MLHYFLDKGCSTCIIKISEANKMLRRKGPVLVTQSLGLHPG